MSEFIKPTRVQALPQSRIYIEFSDGTKGEVDLSDLAGKGVFEVWNDYRFFERVFLGNHREIKWTEEIELSADSLYLRLTGKSPAELFPRPAGITAAAKDRTVALIEKCQQPLPATKPS